MISLRLAPLFAVILFTTGCGPRQTLVEQANQEGILHVGSPGEPSELDPHIINAPADFRIVPMLFDGLVRGHPATLQPEPAIAHSWDISADGLTYTFHLRENAVWSNGDPVISADFLYAWQRALTPELASQYTFLFSAVAGADDYNAGRSTDFGTVGLTAPNAHTVVITLRRPTPYFLTIVANNPIWYPVHRATVEATGPMTARGSGWTKPENFVGNGPFSVAEWRPNDIIRLKRSPTYWDAGRVELQGIVYHAYDSIHTEERAFRAEQLHRTTTAPKSKLDAYRVTPDTPLREIDGLYARFINVNVTRPPFDDARVRRAFALALDRTDLAQVVYRETAVPAYRIVPLGMPSYPKDGDFLESAETARAELAAAGYPEGEGFPVVELSTESGGTASLSEAIQARWREVLGVQVEIVLSETRVHWEKLNQKDFTLAHGGWVADYPDATTYLDLWKSSSGWNFTQWNDPAYDAALERAANMSDPGQRARALREAEGILMEHMPIIPTVFEKDLMLMHPSMENFTPNAMDRPDYSTVRLRQ
jgi:oligopeptide transport system substrate-binding protein